MNDKIIDKISELMQVSYDKALELYPIVKIQFLWYEFFDKIINVLIAFLIFEAAILLTLGIAYVGDISAGDFDFKKYIKITIWGDIDYGGIEFSSLCNYVHVSTRYSFC